MKSTSIILAYAIGNILVAAILFYLWETSSYVISLNEAISGTATLRFWLFVSGVAGIFAFFHFLQKEKPNENKSNN
jgi:hypothetical protein